jgi:hypothetical protein
VSLQVKIFFSFQTQVTDNQHKSKYPAKIVLPPVVHDDISKLVTARGISQRCNQIITNPTEFVASNEVSEVPVSARWFAYRI